MGRTLEEIIALLEADINGAATNNDDYDGGFADGTKNAIFLIKQMEKGGSKMALTYIVEIDYKTFIFDDRDDALNFAEMAAITSERTADVTVKIKGAAAMKKGAATNE